MPMTWKNAARRPLAYLRDALQTIVPSRRSAALTADDRLLNDAIRQASAVQNLGYDIAFAFLPRFPDAPNIYMCNSRYGTKQYGNGFDTQSRGIAMKKALSEIVERTLWYDDGAYWATGSYRATAHAAGHEAIDLASVSGFSEAQRSALPGGPLRSDQDFLWTPGTSMADGSRMCVPAQLISGKYARTQLGLEPMLRTATSNGLASHDSYDEAAYRGLLELIERDAFMITFHNQISAPRIDPASITNLATRSVLDALLRFEFTIDILLLPTDCPTSVVCCVLRDTRGGPALTLGAKAHHDTEEAVRGALLEAHAVWHTARVMKRYEQPLPAQPWGTVDRIAYWARPEHTAQLAWLWSGPMEPLKKSGANVSTGRGLAIALKKNSVDACVFHMSTREIERIGFHAVCVFSPQLIPLYLESEPIYLGGERFRTVPRAFGYTPRHSPPPYTHPFP